MVEISIPWGIFEIPEAKNQPQGLAPIWRRALLPRVHGKAFHPFRANLSDAMTGSYGRDRDWVTNAGPFTQRAQNLPPMHLAWQH